MKRLLGLVSVEVVPNANWILLHACINLSN